MLIKTMPSGVNPYVDSAEYVLESIDEAYRSQEQKTAKGKVVINIGQAYDGNN